MASVQLPAYLSLVLQSGVIGWSYLDLNLSSYRKLISFVFHQWIRQQRDDTVLNGDRKQISERDDYNWPWSVWDTSHSWLCFVQWSLAKYLNPGPFRISWILTPFRKYWLEGLRSWGWGVLVRIYEPAFVKPSWVLGLKWREHSFQRAGVLGVELGMGWRHSPLKPLSFTWRSGTMSWP